ncbi:MAG: 2-C-methyl-D-erythritol 4-phosphate cytidylyltransferase [bacterium]
MNIAVILAAGKSRRMRKNDKIFCQIKGKPLIFYTISAFQKNYQINKIILVARKKFFKRFSSLTQKYGFNKVAAVVEGGKERQDSSFNGLKMAKNLGAKLNDLILFHNGANPLISQEEINAVIKEAKKHKAALIGQPAKDTVKEINKNGFLARTIDRQKIFLAQTPQAIEYKLAEKAFKKALKEKFKGTDDVSLVERMGKKVKAVPGSFKNIKATYSEDLRIIEALLEE